MTKAWQNQGSRTCNELLLNGRRKARFGMRRVEPRRNSRWETGATDCFFRYSVKSLRQIPCLRSSRWSCWR